MQIINFSWLSALLLIALVISPRAAQAAEPNVDEVRRVALAFAGLDGKAPGWARRARLRHLVPRISGRVAWMDQVSDGVEFDEFLSRDGEGELLFDGAQNETQRDTRQRVTYSVHATIDMGGLIFDRAELQASRERRQWTGDRMSVIEAVHRAYFRRLALRDSLRAAEEAERRALALELLEVEAELDGLTGGWFRRKLDGGE